MDTSKLTAFAVMTGSANQVEASRLTAFAVMTGSANQVEASRLAAFAVVVQLPDPPPPEPVDWPDADDPVELYTFSIPSADLAWRYCTDTSLYTFGGETFVPEAISRTAVSRSVNELSSNMTIELGDRNPFLLQMLAGMTVRPVQVLVQRVQRGAATAQVVFTGVASNASVEGAGGRITCLPRSAVASKRKLPWLTFQSGCNWQVFSEGCGVDASFYLTTHSLGSSAFAGVQMTIAGTHADGDLTNGFVERVSDGDTRFIEKNVGNLLTLQRPFSNVTGIELWRVYPGCRRTEADCRVRYNNLANFLGWERLPGLNPYQRSAFYLNGPVTPPAPPAGTTFDLGGGYTLTLAPQSTRVRVAGSYGSLPTESVAFTATTSGTMSFLGSPVAGRYISPSPCPPVVVSDLDIWFTSPGTVSGSSSVSTITLTPTAGFGAWRPLTSDVGLTFDLARGTGSGSSGGARADVYVLASLPVRVRRRSSGLVLAEGTLSLGVVASMGYNSNGGGTNPPPGW